MLENLKHSYFCVTQLSHMMKVGNVREPETFIFLCHYFRFGPSTLFGLAPELTPVYRHVLYLYRSRHKDTRWVTNKEVQKVLKLDRTFLFSGH